MSGGPNFGILAFLANPEMMDEMRERERIAGRLAEQAGLTLPEAFQALRLFEECPYDGQVLH